MDDYEFEEALDEEAVMSGVAPASVVVPWSDFQESPISPRGRGTPVDSGWNYPPEPSPWDTHGFYPREPRGRGTPAIVSGQGLSGVPTWVWAVAGLGALWLVFRK